MAPTPKTLAFFALVLMLLAATAAPAALAQEAPAAATTTSTPETSVPAAAGAQSVTPEACRARLQSEGGESALVSRAPSCAWRETRLASAAWTALSC